MSTKIKVGSLVRFKEDSPRRLMNYFNTDGIGVVWKASEDANYNTSYIVWNGVHKECEYNDQLEVICEGR